MKQLELQSGQRFVTGSGVSAYRNVSSPLVELTNLAGVRRDLNVTFGKLVDRSRIKPPVVPHREGLAPFLAERVRTISVEVPAYPYSPSQVREIFEPLADQWEKETEFLSMTPQITGHPAYVDIMALSYPAVPLILERLKRNVRPWFRALTAMARENPAKDAKTNSEASEAWLSWGRARGLIG